MGPRPRRHRPHGRRLHSPAAPEDRGRRRAVVHPQRTRLRLQLQHGSSAGASTIEGRPGLPFMDNLRRQQLYDALATRILIMDGAMGTMLQAYNPTVADFGGPGLENCSENLSRTHPEWILEIHRAYLEAGADIIETNSFQGSPIVLAEFGRASDTHALNVLAAQIA